MDLNEKDAFQQHLDNCKQTIKTWPKWMQNLNVFGSPIFERMKERERMEDLQKRLNSVSYPPTHTYLLKGPTPTGQLKKRVDIMSVHFPEFFQSCKSFLDIGCNKGFFSMLFTLLTRDILGIDNRKEFITLCKELSDIPYFEHTSFRDLCVSTQMDRIFIGNVAHYMFVDCGGTHDWVAKLAAISNGLVLFEGPIDSTDCPDMDYVFKNHPGFFDAFNSTAFHAYLEPFFELVHATPSIPESPGRCMILFRKKPTGMDRSYPLKQFVVRKEIKETEQGRVFLSELFGHECIVKTYKCFGNDNKVAMHVASLSPWTSPSMGSVVREDGSFTGWVEPIYEPVQPLKDPWTELWEAHCKHQLWLIRQGYIDTDIAVVNMGRRTSNGPIITLDKNGVIPIPALTKGHMNLYFHYMKENFFNRLEASGHIKMLKDAWTAVFNKEYSKKFSRDLLEQVYIDLSTMKEEDL